MHSLRLACWSARRCLACYVLGYLLRKANRCHPAVCCVQALQQGGHALPQGLWWAPWIDGTGPESSIVYQGCDSCTRVVLRGAGCSGQRPVVSQAWQSCVVPAHRTCSHCFTVWQCVLSVLRARSSSSSLQLHGTRCCSRLPHRASVGGTDAANQHLAPTYVHHLPVHTYTTHVGIMQPVHIMPMGRYQYRAARPSRQACQCRRASASRTPRWCSWWRM